MGQFMKNLSLRLTLGHPLATVLLLGCISSVGQANTSANSEFVDSMAMSFPGTAAVIRIKNTASNKHVDNVKLSVIDNSMAFTIAGRVDCDPGINVKFKGAHAYFGNVALGGFGQLVATSTLHTDTLQVGYKEKKNDVVEYTEDTFSVPLNKVKNGPENLKIDPLQALNEKLQAHLQGGGKAVDFFRNDQDIVLQRPLSLVGICGNNSDNSVGYITKNHTVQIKYEGDPAVFEQAKLNAQLVNNNPNQVNNILPFKLDKAEFQPNMPHYTGQCLPDKNPKIRMNFQVSGSERGLIDLRVAAVSNTYGAYPAYFTTTGMIRDPKNGGGYLDFEFPLKELISQQKYSYMTQVNKTWNHNMRIEARYKNLENGTWSEYKPFDTAVFRHRCTPVINPGVGNGGGVQGFDNSPDTPKLPAIKQPLPTPKPGFDKASQAPESNAPQRLAPPQAEPRKPQAIQAASPAAAPRPAVPIADQLKQAETPVRSGPKVPVSGISIKEKDDSEAPARQR